MSKQSRRPHRRARQGRGNANIPAATAVHVDLPLGLNTMVRSSCSECSGPISWMTPDQARTVSTKVDEAIQHMGTDDLDVWRCLDPSCDEWGFVDREWHTGDF